MEQCEGAGLSNEALDRFIAELDKPAKPVPELVKLFKKNPEIAVAFDRRTRVHCGRERPLRTDSNGGDAT